MSIAVPYSWLKQLPPIPTDAEEAPLLGYAPPFPWDQFTALFAKIFQLEQCEIKRSPWTMREPKELLQGLGSAPLLFNIDVGPLSGKLSWLLAEKDVDKLMALLLTKNAEGGNFIDPEYRQGFYRFLALEVFNIFNKLEYDKGLTPHLLSDTELPSKGNLCQDITAIIANTSLTGRLILSDELHQSWRERFAQNKLNVELSPELAAKLQLLLHVEVGQTTLKLSEWNQLALGDFLLLEQCSLETDLTKGRGMLTLNSKPLFRVKIKEGSIKILESPLYHEVETTMSSKDDEDDLSEEFYDEDETLTEFEEEAESLVEEPKKEAPRSAAPKTEKKEPEEGLAKPVPIAKEISLTVVVEVGRIQMSVQKLMELEPGNLLDLSISPENGVDLVVNGNVIAKGELLKIGDSLGVRILDKG
jgi:flagellar motor switch protein FliN/FliY